ncbi:hypothetical protein L1987_51800 [Smallanthus sonchifolius]|uniref:Uncharacterized protein n=1 Tax=Smallanthus sonchifolius TaxID=185202 RepID=A0ACB9ERN2_9ASTR|nr:hypothetical protein L1987_51800 [Smallanthus sonchifolius]
MVSTGVSYEKPLDYVSIILFFNLCNYAKLSCESNQYLLEEIAVLHKFKAKIGTNKFKKIDATCVIS